MAKNIKKINSELKKQVQTFVEDICINTWGMDEKQVQKYCLMIVKQNVLMSDFDSDYLETAKAYAPFAGIKTEEIESLVRLK